MGVRESDGLVGGAGHSDRQKKTGASHGGAVAADGTRANVDNAAREIASWYSSGSNIRDIGSGLRLLTRNAF
jgi:hypothetical protein